MMNKNGQVGLRPYVISLVLVVIASIFLLMFVGQFIQTKNPTSEILDHKYGLNQTISNLTTVSTQFSTLSGDVYNQMGDAEPSATDFLFLIFKGAFYIPLAFLAFVYGAIKVLVVIVFTSLGGTGGGFAVSLISSAIFSGIIITIVLLIISAIRTGNSER